MMDGDLYTIDAITSDSITYSTYNDKDDTVDTITESIENFLAKNINPVIPESMPKVTKVHNQNIYIKVENKKPNELNMTLESF
jgi:hypothetical protein